MSEFSINIDANEFADEIVQTSSFEYGVQEVIDGADLSTAIERSRINVKQVEGLEIEVESICERLIDQAQSDLEADDTTDRVVNLTERVSALEGTVKAQAQLIGKSISLISYLRAFLAFIDHQENQDS